MCAKEKTEERLRFHFSDRILFLKKSGDDSTLRDTTTAEKCSAHEILISHSAARVYRKMIVGRFTPRSRVYSIA